MEDLFGQQVVMVNGHPLEGAHPFTEDEAAAILDQVVHGGELLSQLTFNLKRLRKLIASKKPFRVDGARRDAWEDLVWVYDLYESPSLVPFDVACDAVGLDAEVIRSGISSEFGDELRAMGTIIQARFPEHYETVKRKLGKYIVIGLH